MQAKEMMKGIASAAEIIAALTAVVGAAGTLKDAAQEIVPEGAVPAMAEKAKGALDAVADKADGAKGAVAAFADKAVAAKNSLGDKVREKKEARDLAKALKEARQVLLKNASRAVTVKEFTKLREGESSAAAVVATGLFESPGCFVLATYAKRDHDSDLTDYLGVYVGRGENVGQAVERACSRAGNPDIYADVKYDQNVHLYVYPCAVDEFDAKESALIALLGADESYNAVIE